MKFINRQAELAKLNELWEQKRSQLVVMYGKRRVGKTELIKLIKLIINR
jgi:AAA+ ATPase superfamily predicted ATPase